MFVRLLTIACFSFGFYLLNCGPLPPPPPGPENAFVALEFKKLNGEITKNTLTDSVGKQIKICLIHNLTQYIDSSVLKITMGTEYNDVFVVKSFKANVDTTQYPVMFSAAGTYSVSFTGYIEGEATTFNGTITILGQPQTTQNQKPELNLPEVERTGVGQELVFSVSATDPDANQQVEIKVVKKPESATFAENQFKWTPAITDTGAVTIIFTAIDNGSPVLSVTDSLIIIVAATPVNRSPKWNPSKMQRTIAPEVLFSMDVSPYCSDPDNDKLSLSLKPATPARDTIIGNVYQFTPSVADTGKHLIYIVATDPSGLTDTFTLELTVSSSGSSTADKDPPVILFKSPSKDTIVSADSCEIKVTCIDDSGCAVKGSRDGIAFDMKKSASVANLWTGVAKGIAAGNYSIIKIVATDSSKAGNKDSVSVRIKYDNDKSGPVVTLVTPNKDSVTTSTSSYTIVLKVTDPSGVLSVNGASGATTYTGVKDTGSIWKVNISTLENNKVSAVAITATDSSLKANKAFDTVYIKCEIKNGYTITFDKNDNVATGYMVKQTVNNGDSARLPMNVFVKDGFTFAGWMTTPAGTNITYSDGAMYKMGTSDVILYAKWIRKTTFALNIAAINGTVIKTPNAAVYDSGVVVTLTPVPADNYHFSGWSGALTGSANPATIIMNSEKSITAGFEVNTKNSFSLTVLAENGTVTKFPDAESYDSGTVVTLTATSAAGYQFTGWSGGLTGTTNPTSITMNSAKSVTANFAIKTYALTITSTNGSVTKSPNAPSYDSGTVVTLTATPAAGYQFTGWTGGITGGTNPSSITMNSAKSVTANFVIKTYALTITSTNGSVTKSPNAPSYDSGTVVTLTATPATGYQFTGWSGGLTGGTNPSSITMNSANSVTANFVAIPVTLTLINDGHGTTTPTSTATGSYNVPITISATPATGYSFNNWTVTVGGTNATFGNATTASTTVTLTGNATIRANFAADPVTLIVTNNGNGTTNPSGTVSGTYNNPIAIRATAAARYGFSGWTVTAGAGNVTFGSVSSATTTATLTGDATIRANFVQTAYRVVYDGNGQTGGSAPVDNTDYTSGSTATIKPNSGALIQGSYSFVGWENTSTAEIYECGKQVTITGDLNLTARYSFDRVMDNDGNVYTSILIGTRRWLLQNLKTTKYRDGSSIYQVTNGTAWTTRTKSSASDVCAWADFSSTQSQFGRLYNWSAVEREIAPAGWRIPTQADWNDLYSQANSNVCQIIADWGSTCSGSPGEINLTGFSLLESGYMSQYDNEPGYWSNSGAYVWASNPTSTYASIFRAPGGVGLSYYNIGDAQVNPLGYGCVIRCVKE